MQKRAEQLYEKVKVATSYLCTFYLFYFETKYLHGARPLLRFLSQKTSQVFLVLTNVRR